MSIKKGSVTIASSVPTTEWGSIEGTLSDQTDLQNALNARAPKLSPAFTGVPTVPLAEEGTNTNQIASTKFVNTAIENALEDIDVLPSQAGQSGKYLTTNGSEASWANVDALPSQTGQAGKVLTTNGSVASWTEYSPTPDVDGDTIHLNSSDELEAIGVIEKNANNVKYDWVGTYAEWEAGRANETIPDSWICYITDDYVSSTVTHNIGDIFYSLRTDTMFNGAVACDGTQYDIANYSEGTQSLKSLLDSGKLPYVSITDFDATVTANGSCRCFGYDGSTATVFKVPKLNDVFIEAGVAANNSEFIEAGLPNITGTYYQSNEAAGGFASVVSSSDISGALYGTSGHSGTGNYSLPGNQSTNGLGFDASRSNSIYGNSDTVQPNAVKYKAYIQLANATSESALQTVSSVVNDVNDLKNEIKETLNYGNITNCITEIPQDIKLELSDGTLTLKAGSKVYVPNGFEQDGTTPHFDEIIITNDITRAEESITDRQYFTCYKNDYIFMAYVSGTFSGPTQPTVTGTVAYWYDTTNNLIKRTNDSGATWSSGYSLPYGLVTVSSGSISSIDQIFNGFGYIGSTVFALPGVKYLAANGLNADGTLKSTAITLNNLVVRYFSLGNSNYTSWLNHQGQIGNQYSNQVAYDPKTNYIVSAGISVPGCLFVDFTINSNMITSFNSKASFHALDYNDKSSISSWPMPSGRYIDLTLEATGTNYTAPANGYVCIAKTASANNQYTSIYVAKEGVTTISGASDVEYGYGTFVPSGNYTWVSCPVIKGRTYGVSYSTAGATQAFRFIYSEGEI